MKITFQAYHPYIISKRYLPHSTAVRFRYPRKFEEKWGQPLFFGLPTPFNTCSIPYFLTVLVIHVSVPHGTLFSQRSRASSSVAVIDSVENEIYFSSNIYTIDPCYLFIFT